MRYALWACALFATGLPFAVRADTPPDLEPGDPGWYGPVWLGHNLFEVTPRVGAVDHFVVVSVFGMGVQRSWTTGPYREARPFQVPVVLPADINAVGLVTVNVRVEVVDPTTGVRVGNRGADTLYVERAGVTGERWLDAATAELKVIRLAPAEAGFVEDALVGLEVVR